MDFLLLVILWVTWCFLHSAMISVSVTEYLRKRFPAGFRYYRIIFNITAVISLIPVLMYGASLESPVVVAWEGLWRCIPVTLALAALFFFAAGARRYDFMQFIGFRQLEGNKTCSVLTDDCTLDTRGVLSIVRHPWYTGGLLIIWARPLDRVAILSNLIISGYFFVGAMLEERKLRAQFRRQYEDYTRRVSMFFPFKWVTRRFSREKGTTKHV